MWRSLYGRFLSVAGPSTRDAARSFWPDLVGLAGHSFNSCEHRATVVQYQKRVTQCVLAPSRLQRTAPRTPPREVASTLMGSSSAVGMMVIRCVKRHVQSAASCCRVGLAFGVSTTPLKPQRKSLSLEECLDSENHLPMLKMHFGACKHFQCPNFFLPLD
jgi:hypothetical protein